jgi:hypothetical protein
MASSQGRDLYFETPKRTEHGVIRKSRDNLFESESDLFEPTSQYERTTGTHPPDIQSHEPWLEQYTIDETDIPYQTDTLGGTPLTHSRVMPGQYTSSFPIMRQPQAQLPITSIGATSTPVVRTKQFENMQGMERYSAMSDRLKKQLDTSSRDYKDETRSKVDSAYTSVFSPSSTPSGHSDQKAAPQPVSGIPSRNLMYNVPPSSQTIVPSETGVLSMHSNAPVDHLQRSTNASVVHNTPSHRDTTHGTSVDTHASLTVDIDAIRRDIRGLWGELAHAGQGVEKLESVSKETPPEMYTGTRTGVAHELRPMQVNSAVSGMNVSTRTAQYTQPGESGSTQSHTARSQEYTPLRSTGPPIQSNPVGTDMTQRDSWVRQDNVEKDQPNLEPVPIHSDRYSERSLEDRESEFHIRGKLFSDNQSRLPTPTPDYSPYSYPKDTDMKTVHVPTNTLNPELPPIGVKPSYPRHRDELPVNMGNRRVRFALNQPSEAEFPPNDHLRNIRDGNARLNDGRPMQVGQTQSTQAADTRSISISPCRSYADEHTSQSSAPLSYVYNSQGGYSINPPVTYSGTGDRTDSYHFNREPVDYSPHNSVIDSHCRVPPSGYNPQPHTQITNENRVTSGARANEFNYSGQHTTERRPMTRREKEPEKFDGKSVDWQDYIVHFEQVAAWNGWSEREMTQQLVMCLKGTAQKLLGDLETHQFDYLEFKNILAQRFHPPERETAYRCEFRTRRRQKGETAADYGYALRRLGCNAYPDMAYSAREICIVDQYINGLGNQDIRRHVQFNHPTTLAAAISLAVEFEAFEGAHPQKPRSDQNADTNVGLFPLQTQQPQQTQPKQPPGPSHLQHVMCYVCHNHGHLSYDCVQNPNRQQQRRYNKPANGQNGNSRNG